MMNAMSRFIDTAERIVTVEDAAELQLQQPHVVRLETRPASLDGKGEVNARDLVRNAFTYAARSHHHRRGSRRRGI